MLSEVCAEIRNYFTYSRDIHIADWAISNGIITPSLDIPTNYIRIVGSRLNDGVHKVSEMQLHDESFHGGIWIMSIPADFLSLVAEIETWQANNGSPDSMAMSPFSSESLGAYSYSKGSISRNGSSIGGVVTWKDVYASRLNRYRKVNAYGFA